MERYNEYKDSGVQWLGEIPSHWGLRKMKYTFGERSQKGFPNEPLLAATQNHGVIKKSDYENRTVEATKNLDTLKLVEKGDFVISLRSFQGGIEYSYCRGIISPAYTVLKAHHLTEPYFKHLAKSPIFIDLLKSTVTGIREGQNIDYNKLKVEFMPIPTIEEQQAIATYLDRATAKIDEAIAQQQKMIDLLNERKQIIINNAVTKGLNPNAPMKDSGVDWIGEIPEHWEVMPIKRIKSKEKNAFVDGPFGSNLKSEHFVENGEVYVIESGLITTGKYVHRELKTITKSHFDTIKRSECKANDIIIAKIGARFGMAGELPELGKPCVVSGNSLKLTLDQSVMLNGMFVYYMGLAKWKGGFIGLYQETAQPALSLGALNNMMLPVPPIEEQIYIVEQTNKKLDLLDTAISNATKQIALLQERKQIIINDVVTGKAKVTN